MPKGSPFSGFTFQFEQVRQHNLSKLQDTSSICTFIKVELADVRMVSNLAALWFTRLVVGLSSQRLRFDPRLVDVELVEDKLALGLGFLRVLRLPHVSITSLKLHTHLLIYNWTGEDTVN